MTDNWDDLTYQERRVTEILENSRYQAQQLRELTDEYDQHFSMTQHLLYELKDDFHSTGETYFFQEMANKTQHYFKKVSEDMSDTQQLFISQAVGYEDELKRIDAKKESIQQWKGRSKQNEC